MTMKVSIGGKTKHSTHLLYIRSTKNHLFLPKNGMRIRQNSQNRSCARVDMEERSLSFGANVVLFTVVPVDIPLHRFEVAAVLASWLDVFSLSHSNRNQMILDFLPIVFEDVTKALEFVFC